MQLVRSGEADALDQITRCYGQRLFAAGRRHCRTATEAEDAVQETLIAASQHLAELRDDRGLEGWLVRVVASACRRLGRGHKNAADLHDTELELEDADDGPEVEAARRELAQLLEAELLQLSPEDRSILLLAELEDFSSQQIADELGMTAGAVRVRLSRMRVRLAQKLSAQSP